MNNRITSLEMRDIVKRFPGVLSNDQVGIKIAAGEILALLGENGAGKTTLMNVLYGLYQPDGGSNAGKYTKRIVKTPDVITSVGIARTFQNIRLFKDLSVLENVMIAMHMHLKSGYFSDMLHMNRTEEQKLRQDSIDILEMVGLGSMLDDQASSLPYGQQK